MGIGKKGDKSHLNGIIEAYTQAIKDAAAAGQVGAPQNPTCVPVVETGSPASMENSTVAPSGTVSPIEAASRKDVVNSSNKTAEIDPSMRRDSDGDGLVDGLEKQQKTRAEIATEKAEEKKRKAERRKHLNDDSPFSSLLKGIENTLSIEETTKAQEQTSSLLGNNLKVQGLNQGPGNLDLFLNDDKNDQVDMVSPMDD